MTPLDAARGQQDNFTQSDAIDHENCKDPSAVQTERFVDTRLGKLRVVFRLRVLRRG